MKCQKIYYVGYVVPEFDAETFIVSIKERPVLWDLSSDVYANRAFC